jgi:predicted nucleic acid-binding protein
MIPRPLPSEFAAADAMIWIYGHDRKSPYYSCCRKVRNMIAGGEFKGCIVVQTATEIVGAVSNPRNYRIPGSHLDFSSALALVSDVLNTPNLRLILPTTTSLTTAISLSRKYNIKRKQWYDAVLAATLLDNKVRVLYTMNEKDFLPITELSLINPHTESLRTGSLSVGWQIETPPPPEKPDVDTTAGD